MQPYRIHNLVIWGNHSPTMVPDYTAAKLENNGAFSSVETAVGDKAWLEKVFMEKVRDHIDVGPKAWCRSDQPP